MSETKLNDQSGSHPRVEKVLRDWMINDAKGLTFGTDAEKADCWQKATSRLEKLARILESELDSDLSPASVSMTDTELLDWIERKQLTGEYLYGAIHWDGRTFRECINEAIDEENTEGTQPSSA
jgi:hypothetical protein